MNDKSTDIQEPRVARWYGIAIVVILAFIIADLAVLYIRPEMIPQGTAGSRPNQFQTQSQFNRNALRTILDRNIFSADGKMPIALSKVGKDPEQLKAEEIPVLSSLPMTLVGTLVHSNPEKSIAAIEVKGKNINLPYTPGKDIQGIARLTAVERQRAIFRNLSNNRLEYIEMKKENSKIQIGGGAIASPGKDIVKINDNTFAIKRSDLLKYTNNLNSILMQARAVPNTDASGNINGFRLADIQPNSVFTELGLQKNDVIQAVDGAPVDSLPKAMELYKALKDNPKLNLTIERSGKKEVFNYNIN